MTLPANTTTTPSHPVRVLVIPPAVHHYRRAFYDGLNVRLQASGGALLVANGDGSPEIMSRETLIDGPWSANVATRWMRIAGRDAVYRSVRSLVTEFQPTHIIVEQAIRNLETYPLLAEARLRGSSVAAWGHGKTFTKDLSGAEQRLKDWLTRRMDWFFAYTREGLDYVTQHGYPAEQVTVVDNTLDVSSLRKMTQSLSEPEVRAFRAENGLTSGATALFIGGLDSAKGTDTLIDVARFVSREIPDFTLSIAGRGPGLDAVLQAQSAGLPIRYLGRLYEHEKALALRACDLLICPKSVGLVAVDALAAGKPLLTMDVPHHGPELAYLVEGRHRITTQPHARALADAVVTLLGHPRTLTTMQTDCLDTSYRFEMDGMVNRFHQGIQRWAAATSSARLAEKLHRG